VKRDALELRRPHTADEADALQSRQRAVVDVDALVVPPHTIFERLFDSLSTPMIGLIPTTIRVPAPRQYACGWSVVI